MSVFGEEAKEPPGQSESKRFTLKSPRENAGSELNGKSCNFCGPSGARPPRLCAPEGGARPSAPLKAFVNVKNLPEAERDRPSTVVRAHTDSHFYTGKIFF